MVTAFKTSLAPELVSGPYFGYNKLPEAMQLVMTVMMLSPSAGQTPKPRDGKASLVAGAPLGFCSLPFLAMIDLAFLGL